MREFGAMLKMDLLSLKAVVPWVLIVLCVGAVVSFTGQGDAAAVTLSAIFPFIVMLAIMVPMNILSKDQSTKLPTLYVSLPMKRSTVMASHYLCSAGAFVVIGVVIEVFAFATGDPGEPLSAAAVLGGVALVAALIMPLQVKFGSAAMFISMIVMMVLAFGGGMLAGALADSSDLDRWLAWGSQHVGLIVGALWGLVILAWICSYLISRRVWIRKDF